MFHLTLQSFYRGTQLLPGKSSPLWQSILARVIKSPQGMCLSAAGNDDRNLKEMNKDEKVKICGTSAVN